MQQKRALLTRLPKWFDTDFFEIEARAEGNPTRDQMRLMMQSLLSERFKLTVHFESPVVPVLALTIVKPASQGRSCVRTLRGPPCGEYSIVPGPMAERTTPGDVWPPFCGSEPSRRGATGAHEIGARNVSMTTVEDTIYNYGSMAGEVDNPVVDHTGLTGSYDFTLDYGGDMFGRAVPPVPAAASLDPDGPSFLTALRDQLGLKLASSKAPVRMIVIDHVEKPSGN